MLIPIIKLCKPQVPELDIRLWYATTEEQDQVTEGVKEKISDN